MIKGRKQGKGSPRRNGLSLVIGIFSLVGLSCSLFDPREAEDPIISSCISLPPTNAGLVLQNLQCAVEDKHVANYKACFDSSLVFIPSSDAIVLYPGVLNNWTYSNEQSYFSNLVSRSVPNGFSSLVLTRLDSIISADSVTYTIRYSLIFEHTELGFPITAHGNLQFTLGTNNLGSWMIHRWSDSRTNDSLITWSSFKGRFSN